MSRILSSHLKDKVFFTPQEAAAWERQVADRNEEPSPAHSWCTRR